MALNNATVSSSSQSDVQKWNKDNSLLYLFIDYVLPLEGQSHSARDVSECVDWLQLSESSSSSIEATDFQITVKNKLEPMLKMLLDAKNNVNFANRLDESILRVFLTKYAKDNCSTNDDNKDRDLIAALMRRGASVDVIDSIGYTPLQYAATIRRPDLLRLMIDNSADLNLRNSLGHTALHLLVYNYEQHPSELHLEALRDLLLKGADVRAKNKQGLTPVHLAIQNGLVKVLLVFRENGIDVGDYTGSDSNLLLHLCKNVGSWTRSSAELQALQLLVDLERDVSSRSRKFYLTPLHFVAQVDRADVIELFLQARADVDARSVDGLTPLHLAALRGSPAAVEHLIRSGADVDARDEMIGFALMHMSVLSGDRDKVKLLIENGFDVNVRSKHGLTPLHLAVIMADKKMLKCLIERCVNFRGRHMGMMLRLNSVDHVDCQEARIIIVGADETVAEMSLVSQYVNKCLDVSAEYLEGLTMLLHEAGADVNARDSTLRMPLHYAAMQRDTRLIEMILSLGARVDARDAEGRSPLQNCLDAGNTKGLDELTRFGADFNDAVVDGNFYEWSADVRNRLYDYAIQLEAVDLPIADFYKQRHLRDTSMSFYRWSCHEEATKLKCYSVPDSKVSLYDFIHASSRRRLSFAQNVLTIDLGREFPIYRNVIEAHCREAIGRNSLMRQAGSILCELAGVNLPDICTDHIFSFLDNRQLIIVIDSYDEVDVDPR